MDRVSGSPETKINSLETGEAGDWDVLAGPFLRPYQEENIGGGRDAVTVQRDSRGILHSSRILIPNEISREQLSLLEGPRHIENVFQVRGFDRKPLVEYPADRYGPGCEETGRLEVVYDEEDPNRPSAVGKLLAVRVVKGGEYSRPGYGQLGGDTAAVLVFEYSTTGRSRRAILCTPDGKKGYANEYFWLPCYGFDRDGNPAWVRKDVSRPLAENEYNDEMSMHHQERKEERKKED